MICFSASFEVILRETGAWLINMLIFSHSMTWVHVIISLERVKSWNKIRETNILQVQAGVLNENAALQWVTIAALKVLKPNCSNTWRLENTRTWTLFFPCRAETSEYIHNSLQTFGQLKVFALLASKKETVDAIPKLYFIPTPPRFFRREYSFQKYLPPLTKVPAWPQTYTTAATQNPINIAGDSLGRGRWWWW